MTCFIQASLVGVLSNLFSFPPLPSPLEKLQDVEAILLAKAAAAAAAFLLSTSLQEIHLLLEF